MISVIRQLRGVVAALVLLLTASAVAAQTVTIVKSTNGQDANSPPGPVVSVGSTVTWTFVVTNTGGRDLTGVTVNDNQLGAVPCPATVLAAGTSMTCTASGTAAAGQYTNIGTVSATVSGGGTVTASDPSHYYGQPAGLITLVKSTNGQDANSPPGPIVAVGSAVTWTYLVSNTGSDPLTAVSVTDDQGVAVTCPKTTLAVGESMTCTASGTAVANQYSNVGTATATHPVFGTIVASDASHYFGQSAIVDFGDAPDSYGTTMASDGARHVLSGGVYLGSCVDAELDGLATPAANGDDANVGTSTTGSCATAGADEDGVTFNGSLTAGQTASVTVIASAPCTLSAWIDFGHDGSFLTGDDIFPAGKVLAAGANALTFSVPSTASGGATYARFRCTTDGAVAPTGVARDGEVEDYAVSIQPSADLSVTKIDTPDPVTPGGTLTYAITVNNAGPSSATAVILTDTPPVGTTFTSIAAPPGWTCNTPAVGAYGPISCSASTIAVGTAFLTLTVATSPAAAPGSLLSNTATVTSSTFDSVSSNNSATAVTTIGASIADLRVAKTDSPDPVDPGSTLIYTITVTNVGPSNATAASVADTLPVGTSFVSVNAPAGWGCTTPAVGAGGAISCSVAVLTPGSSVFTMVVRLDPALAPGTSLSNSVGVTSASADPTPSDNTATASTLVGAGQADLLLIKAATPAFVTPGSNMTYTVRISNSGPSNATSLTFTDALAGGTNFVSLAAPAGWQCTTPPTGANGSISCTAASLSLSTNAVFTIVVTVSPGFPEGPLSNTAAVSAATPDPVTGDNTSTTTVTVGPAMADVSVVKTDSPDPVSAGSQLTYTMTVTNAGPSNAATVVLSDQLPLETTFVSLVSPAGWSCTTPAIGANAIVSCTMPSMPPGNAVFTLSVAVNASLGPGTAISNTATVSSPVDTTTTNNSSTAGTISQQPAIPTISHSALAILFIVLVISGMVMIRKE